MRELRGLELKWITAYLYLVYLFLATIPQLNPLPPFSDGIPVLVLIMVYLFHSTLSFGVKTLKFLASGGGLGFLFEFLGVHTGFPFGRYYYTPNAGPQVLGVPVLIPLLWATLCYFSFIAVEQAFISSWLMVLIDITVDPLFSRFDWHWITPGQYFGVPLSNFVGWYIVSSLIFLSWKGTGRLTVNVSAILFYFGLVVLLALQDLFAGLVYPGLISVILTTCTTLSLFFVRGRTGKLT